MKLLLTSAGWEKNLSIGKEFLKLVNKKPSNIKVLLVMTPIKYPKRNIYVKRLFGNLNEINVSNNNITFFKLDKKINKSILNDIDVIFVMGGNTFDYLDRIKKTGFDKVIKNFVRKDGVYVGLSAGSYVTCPTIEAATWKHADNNFLGLKNLKGLNLVPFLITAHFEKKYNSIIEEASIKTKYPIIALTDEQAVVVRGDIVKVIGKGKKTFFNFEKF